MMHRGLVANTDQHWFKHFRPKDRMTHVDEVNFWRPKSQHQFRALSPGEPFFFRLKHPSKAIAGFGLFARQEFLTVSAAWEKFADRNGDPSFQHLLDRLAAYRDLQPEDATSLADRSLNCLILHQVVFLPDADWLPWGESEEWQDNIVAYKTYDLSHEPGARLERMRS